MKNLFLVTFILFGSWCSAQTTKVNAGDFIKEVQINKSNGSHVQLAVWLPVEYWRIALQDNPEVTPEVIAKIEDLFKDFIMILAVDAEVSGSGMDHSSKVEAVILDNEKNEYQKLKDKDIPSETREMLKVMKPALGNIMGELGTNMRILMFPAANENGDAIANAVEEGGFSLIYNGETFEWSLPLAVFMAQKKCPVDGEGMNGKWNYCPEHGNELVEGDDSE